MTHNPRRLESYLAGFWQAGKGEGQSLLDAATGDPVATISAEGLDCGEALTYGRDKGGRALRAMSLHSRALMLKALAKALSETKQDFYKESLATGATNRDAAIDIEGGIGTLYAYASKARKELPNSGCFLEGDVEELSRDHSFSGQHILTPLEGIAVHINAYNFPCWGMLEKLAPTLLAGMPALIKPASQTAYLTELMVRRIIESGVLPEGALQLVCGSAYDLTDYMTCQDVVTFTGSAATGQRLKTNPVLVQNSVRFSMEADSLNASVLAPDARETTEEFGLFIKEVTREMTVKSGQKCTAIRRILVPHNLVMPVAEALKARLGAIRPGLPSDEGTKMGALVSLEQREEVRACIKAIAGEAAIICGDPDRVDLSSGDADKGAFLNPVLLYCDKPMSAEAVHSVEAFGSVATLMPYDDPAQAMTIARLGKGSLVVSCFTNSSDHARDFAFGLAPYHGRILFGNRLSSASSTGHGSPMPGLVHGGPGRAGGGEELGGMRAVKHYMQRTAVQGAPHLLAAIGRRWLDGAPVDSKKHPFKKSLSQLKIGDQIVTDSREISLDDIERFADLSGDRFYAHMDEAAAKANPFFEGRVAHGYFVVSLVAGLFVDPAPGPVLANYGIDHLRFLSPVYPGDRLRARLTCKEISPREGETYGEVRWDCQVTNDKEALVARYDILTMVAC